MLRLNKQVMVSRQQPTTATTATAMATNLMRKLFIKRFNACARSAEAANRHFAYRTLLFATTELHGCQSKADAT